VRGVCSNCDGGYFLLVFFLSFVPFLPCVILFQTLFIIPQKHKTKWAACPSPSVSPSPLAACDPTHLASVFGHNRLSLSLRSVSPSGSGFYPFAGCFRKSAFAALCRSRQVRSVFATSNNLMAPISHTGSLVPFLVFFVPLLPDKFLIFSPNNTGSFFCRHLCVPVTYKAFLLGEFEFLHP